ncbi:MAG: hypothetical protein MUF42_07910 [Cytophagaceae bacterium]|nr:hypothetical protein [Cytophagaceae bacterium]
MLRFLIKVLPSVLVIVQAPAMRSEDPRWTLSFKNPIVKATVDRYDFLYVAESNGDIHKLDSLGSKLFTWSPQKRAELTSIDAWRNVNVLLFYRNFQEILLLDRFLANHSTFRLSQFPEIGFARLVALSSDNNLWLIDEQDFSLKKFNLTYHQVTQNTSLDLLLDPDQYELSDLREYQNQVYLLDKRNNLLVFDIMGNYKNKIPVRGMQQLQFRNDELYYTDGDSLRFIHLYQYKTRSLPLPGPTQEQWYLGAKWKYALTDRSVTISKNTW